MSLRRSFIALVCSSADSSCGWALQEARRGKHSDDLKPKTVETSIEPANLWVVVNLFTGKTSRQR